MALAVSMQLTSDYDHCTTNHRDPGKREIHFEQRDTKVDLPSGFPKYLNSDLAWSGSQLSGDQFTYYLTESDKLEIDAALASFKGMNYSLLLYYDLNLHPMI